MTKTTQPQSGRPDDSGYNNPSRNPVGSRRLSRESEAAFDEQDPDLLFPEDPASGRDYGSSAAFRILKRTRRLFRTTLLLLTLLLAVAGLYLYAAALDFTAQVTSYPVYLQWPVWMLLGLVLFIVLYALARIAVLWRSLGRHPQVSLAQVSETDREVAKDQLLRYLNQLLHQKASHWQRLRTGSPDKTEELLLACRRLAKQRHIATDAWLEEFEENVRKPLDAVAAARITYYWRLVGIKTAISPFPLIDSLAVLYNNFLLIGDLATLYGRRIARHEVFILLGFIIFQVFIATRSQELFDSVADDMSQTIQSGVARGLTQFIAPKVAEGTVNAMVTWRIGKRAQRMFHPLTKGKAAPAVA